MITKIKAYSGTFFWLALTYFLAPYFYLRIFWASPKKSKKLLKVLIISTGKIGDLVCMTPVFRAIKEKFPSVHLTALILSKSRGVLRNNPRVDKIMLSDENVSIAGKLRMLRELRKEKYDWAINLLPGSFDNIIAFWSLVPNRAASSHKGAGKIISLLSIFNNYRLEYKSHTRLIGHYLKLLEFLGIKAVSDRKEVFIRPEEERKASDFLLENNLRDDDLLIGISPVPGKKIKQWDLSKFAVLSDLLIEKLGAKIIFSGSDDDSRAIEEIRAMMRNKSINSAGRFKLHELPALFKKLKLFISVDSGPLYMADALDVPVIDIGGSYDIQEQAPSGIKSMVLQKYPVSCSFIFPISPVCMEQHQKSLREILPDDVFDAAKNLCSTS